MLRQAPTGPVIFEGMALAFFDLDRTLLRVNAGSLWIRSEMREGRISRWQAAKAAAWIFGYHLGYSKIETVFEGAVATLANQLEAEVRDRTLAFYTREVASQYRRRAREVVEEHRAKGDIVALLSTTSIYLAGPVQADLGIPHALCNRFLVEDGRFTGQAHMPLCFAAGKLHHAQQLAAELGEDLAAATFYTDSVSDLAVLSAVGHPVAVHPDPMLARVARQRGWPIQMWD